MTPSGFYFFSVLARMSLNSSIVTNPKVVLTLPLGLGLLNGEEADSSLADLREIPIKGDLGDALSVIPNRKLIFRLSTYLKLILHRF